MTPAITIQLIDAPACYRPGDTVRGIARWSLERRPTSIRAELFWRTDDASHTDARRVARQDRPAPPVSGEWAFALAIPRAVPPTYAGRIVRIRWLVQIVADRHHFAQAYVIVSPTGELLKIADISADSALPGR